MAYEYDRFEREDSGGSFLMGLLAGTVLGAGLGMLFAPRAGSELRSQLQEQAGRLRSTAEEGYQQASQKVHQMVDRGREAYERTRTARQGDTSPAGTGTTTGSVGTTTGSEGTTGTSGTSFTTPGSTSRI